MMEFDGIRKRDVEKKDIEERKSLQGKIKEYKLSDEELAEIRQKTGWNRDDFNKEIYVKRKQEGKTDREIMKEFNIYPKKLTDLKREWGLIGVKQEEFLDKQAEMEKVKEEASKDYSTDEIRELQLRIKELEEYEVQLSERNAYLETELTNLSDELERYKSTLTKERTEASSEYERILKKNSELAVMVNGLKEENETLKAITEERDKEIEELSQERFRLQLQLDKSDSEPCQYCETLKEESGQLWIDKNKLITQISELEKEIEWLKNELTEADENIDENDKYKRLWASAAFALKELIEVELFSHGGDADA